MRHFIYAALITLLIAVAHANDAEEAVTELATLRAGSRDGVIPLTEDLLDRLLVGRRRPFTAAIFFSAAQVKTDNPMLRLEELRAEYGLAAKAFAAGKDADKIFFFDAALEASKRPFSMLQVNALPAVVRLLPDQAVSGGTRGTDLTREHKMLPDTVPGPYPWSAETFVEWFGAKAGLAAAPVDRPSLRKSPLFPVLVLAALAVAGWMAWRLYVSGVLRHPAVWATVSLAVFWFSASGGMYNIIRGMPLFIRDRNGRLQFFLSGRQGQLGAEGFTMGALYLAASACLAFLAHAAPRISHSGLRAGSSALGAAVAAAALAQTFRLWTAKTGYQHVFYI